MPEMNDRVAWWLRAHRTGFEFAAESHASGRWSIALLEEGWSDNPIRNPFHAGVQTYVRLVREGYLTL
jgi:hypothetical protein